MAELKPIVESVWSMTHPLRFWGVDTGTRMTVVRLARMGLFIHSPLPLSAELKLEVEALGPVEMVVAPSLFHHMFVADWKRAYPHALFCCCPGLERKRSDVAWDRVLTGRPEPEWEDDLDQVLFDARKLENEVVFFHWKTRTMICADALFNLSTHPSRVTRIAALLLGNRSPGATWIERLLIRDRAAARQQVDRMLEWKPERVLLAHGAPVIHDAIDVLRRAYDWL